MGAAYIYAAWLLVNYNNNRISYAEYCRAYDLLKAIREPLLFGQFPARQRCTYYHRPGWESTHCILEAGHKGPHMRIAGVS